jgi:hypothetical protein
MSEIRTERQARAARSEPRVRELVRPEESVRSGVEAGRLSRLASTTPARIDNRHRSTAKLLAHCPFCGQKHVAMLVSETKKAEDALCTSRCADAWHALSALRGRESENRLLAARRRLESEAGRAHAPPLSALLLQRWRTGNWTVTPDDLFRALNGSDGDACGELAAAGPKTLRGRP